MKPLFCWLIVWMPFIANAQNTLSTSFMIGAGGNSFLSKDASERRMYVAYNLEAQIKYYKPETIFHGGLSFMYQNHEMALYKTRIYGNSTFGDARGQLQFDEFRAGLFAGVNINHEKNRILPFLGIGVSVFGQPWINHEYSGWNGTIAGNPQNPGWKRVSMFNKLNPSIELGCNMILQNFREKRFSVPVKLAMRYYPTSIFVPKFRLNYYDSNGLFHTHSFGNTLIALQLSMGIQYNKHFKDKR